MREVIWKSRSIIYEEVPELFISEFLLSFLILACLDVHNYASVETQVILLEHIFGYSFSYFNISFFGVHIHVTRKLKM